MTSVLASVARGILKGIPLSLYRASLRRDLVGFVYHVVGSPGLPHVTHLYPYKSAASFEQDLVHLEQRYRHVPYDEIAAS